MNEYTKTMIEFEKLENYKTVGKGNIVVLHCDNKPVDQFANTLEAMKFAIEHSKKPAVCLELDNIYYVVNDGYTFLETYDNLSTKEAKKTLDKLFSWFGVVSKPNAEIVCKWDVYPNALKMIQQGSLTLKQVQNIGKKHRISAGVIEMRINDLKQMN
ncbi:MAG: hypothetical protein VYA01_03735 [Bacteroidota bacterium]|nr:hypothetical protein [Bacteroidota bacterium]MEC7616847.1 hypothetical protein [Bacteroidota bacterium]